MSEVSGAGASQFLPIRPHFAFPPFVIVIRSHREKLQHATLAAQFSGGFKPIHQRFLARAATRIFSRHIDPSRLFAYQSALHGPWQPELFSRQPRVSCPLSVPQRWPVSPGAYSNVTRAASRPNRSIRLKSVMMMNSVRFCVRRFCIQLSLVLWL